MASMHDNVVHIHVNSSFVGVECTLYSLVETAAVSWGSTVAP